MSGLPGSGKSTLVRDTREALIGHGYKVQIISHDHHFMEDGEYKFTSAKYAEAIPECMTEFDIAVENEVDCIIIDNPNMSWENCRYYVKEGLVAKYNVQFKETRTPWRWDIEECEKRNVHGVDAECLMEKKKNYLPRSEIMKRATGFCKKMKITGITSVKLSEYDWGMFFHDNKPSYGNLDGYTGLDMINNIRENEQGDILYEN